MAKDIASPYGLNLFRITGSITQKKGPKYQANRTIAPPPNAKKASMINIVQKYRSTFG